MFNRKALLIFPPVWDTDIPYLGLPQLSSYLRENKIKSNIFDANISFWEYLIQDKYIKEFYLNSRDFLSTLQYDTDLGLTFDEFLLIKEITNQPIEHVLSTYRINLNSRLKLRKAISLYLGYEFQTRIKHKVGSKYYFGYHDPSYHQISLSEYSRNSKNLFWLINSEEKNIYHYFFEDIILSKIQKESPGLIGFNITAPNQVIPTFIFAKYIKTINPKLTVIAGGSWCTLLKDQIVLITELFKYFDAFIFGEGEIPLLNLIQNLEIKDLWAVIPNIAFLSKDDSIYFNDIQKVNELDNLLPPDFNDLPLEKYDLKNTLPLQASRGCDWGRCDFCTYTILDSNYRYRNSELVLSDVIYLNKQYNARHICFVDSIITPEVLHRWIKIFQKEISSITWQAMLKISKKIDQDLFYSLYEIGCRLIIWGIESGSNLILKNMSKGSTAEMASENLLMSTKASIHNRACLMYGYPLETYKEALESISFIQKNIQNIHSLSFGRFALEKGSKLYNQYKHSIEIKDDLAIGLPIEMAMNNTDVDLIKEKFRELSLIISSNYTTMQHRFSVQINPI